MQTIRNAKNAGITRSVIEAIHENAAYLSEIDGATGDGDHGVNMQAILQLLELDAGISFLYEPVVAERIAAGGLREIDLEDFSVTHEFSMVWERGSAYESTYRLICEQLKEGRACAARASSFRWAAPGFSSRRAPTVTASSRSSRPW